ncbi:fibrinogen-like protein 1 [Drosophila takahashii]|uniref:fibrinogen-like protein 1 n=1 Tax=Drosophila takahashii TaxID=29030 RepID=UPI001CF8BB60|nr:fibrinogen-like protein 1 [Drosophila takahashii]
MRAPLIAFFLLILISWVSSNEIFKPRQNVENPCSEHRIWRPILDRFVKVNASEELKSQVNAMAETIKDLQSQIVEKTQEIKDQSARVRVLTANIKHLRAEVKNKDKQITEINGDLLKCSPKNPQLNSSTGWLTIQKRFDGTENFDRSWRDYKDGFGNPKGEFFIGLEKIHLMTRERPHELYINLGKIDGSTGYAHYDDFRIGSEQESFELQSLGLYEGTAGDSLRLHEHQKFTTLDRDNDSYRLNCAADEYGGWWYYNCAQSMLNGKFYKEGHSRDNKTNGILWGSWHNNDWTQSLTFVEMMIRPKTL